MEKKRECYYEMGGIIKRQDIIGKKNDFSMLGIFRGSIFHRTGIKSVIMKY